MKPKVYLAGKITKNGWRNQIIQWPSVNQSHLFDPNIGRSYWLTMHRKNFIYTGPFFVRCDHGCYHGSDTHGYGVNEVCGDGSWRYDNDGNTIGLTKFQNHGLSFVTELCKEAINKSDIILAWIDSVDCYGTIVEIGYAHGLGKKHIYICGPRYIPDLWFLYAMIDQTRVRFDQETPVDFFNYALSQWNIENQENLLESPIEKKFWKAAHKNGFPYTLTPQHVVGRYRLDFAILDFKIAIELDGHDYHKTKEQRTHDASRERWLKENGWDVIRFTGSEIWKDADACVSQLQRCVEVLMQ